LCGGYFDMRDLGAMLEHEEPVRHPVEDSGAVTSVDFKHWGRRKLARDR